MIDLIVFENCSFDTEREEELIIALIDMTNEFISFRNDIWEGVIIPETMEIPDASDKSFIDSLDEKINKAIRVLTRS